MQDLLLQGDETLHYRKQLEHTAMTSSSNGASRQVLRVTRGMPTEDGAGVKLIRLSARRKSPTSTRS